MITQQDLNFVLDRQVREFCNILVTNYSLCIDIQSNILIINISEPVSIAKFEALIKKIGEAAYLKLGCKKVSFYCHQDWLWDYNSDIPDEFNNMTASVLPNLVESQVDLEEAIQQQQSQVALDWISFDGIAQSLGCTKETVNNEVQDYGIFVTLNRNNLGLSGENLEIYLNRRHTSMVEKFRKLLTKKTAPAERTVLQAVPTPTANGSQPAKNGGLFLPDSFDIMDGRKRRPDIPTALKLAIAALPDGDDEKIKKMYIRQIAMRENVESFVEALALQFEGSAKFKNVSQTAKEIYNAARVLWDECLDSSAA